MIKLPDHVIFLRTGYGYSAPVDMAELHQQLVSAGSSQGYHHPELVHELMVLVKNYILCKQAANEAVTLAAIENLIVKVLCEMGLDEVAKAFCECRHIQMVTDADAPVVADLPTIAQILSRDLYFQAKPIDPIAALVYDKIGRLGLTRTTKSLIQALAKTIWLDQVAAALRSVPATRPPPGDGQFLTRHEIVALCAPRYSGLLDGKIVDVDAISLLLPTIHIRIDFERLTGMQAAGSLLEIQLLPTFSMLCEQIGGMVAMLKAELATGTAALKDVDVNVTLLLPSRSEPAVSERRGMPALMRSLQPELTDIVAHYLPATKPLQLVIGQK